MSDPFDDLCKHGWLWAGPCVWCENEKLRSRVEELESQVEELSTRDITEDLNAYLAGDGICITDEMIDGAWRSRVSAIDGAWLRCDKLGIVACKGCGGSASIYEEDQRNEPTVTVRYDCPSCQGHGWVRRNDTRVEELERVLMEIANDGCGLARIVKEGIEARVLWCPDLHPDDKSEWCWSCIARAALEEER